MRLSLSLSGYRGPAPLKFGATPSVPVPVLPFLDAVCDLVRED